MNLMLRPGEILLVQPLAKELGMSRTPVREALIRLEREGFVKEADGKKFRVSELTIKSILEIHEARELIELHAVGKAALRRNKGQLAQLQKFALKMEEALKTNDHLEFFRLDMAFHDSILAIADNETLENLMRQLNEKVQRIRHLTTYIYRRLDDTIGEHHKILRAIEEKQPEAAQQAMKDHLDGVRDGLVSLFEDKALSSLGGILV